MTSFLLDTHVLIWWLEGGSRLSSDVKNLIQSRQSIINVSAVSAWEIEIKKALGKLQAPDDLKEMVQENDFRELPITPEHSKYLQALPRHHRDPFDHMLICQAQAEDLTILTHDQDFSKYEVKLMLV
jgi:PIN domain nuclease of toxin-antitoxin system